MYRRFAYPEQMARYRMLLEHEPQSANDVSLLPFVRHRAIFVHIPKCAGISVATTLFGCRGLGHLEIHEYKNAFRSRDFQRFFKFTFVRNPWDRLASAYFFLRDGGMNEVDEERADQSVRRFPDFEQFVTGFVAQEDFEKVLHFRSQHSFLSDIPGGAARGRFHRPVREDRRGLRPYCRAARPRCLAAAPQCRHLASARLSSLYTDRTAEIVAKAYARDIALFGYDFENGTVAGTS